MDDLFTERFNKLNEEQQKAVITTEGPLLVIAGPGSGKTELLSLRVAHILRTQDVKASNILCLTYTENGATNMRARLVGLIGPDAYKVGIFTFHSFGTWMIQQYADTFYKGISMNPADEIMQIVVLTRFFDNLPLDNPLKSISPDGKYVYLETALSRISSLKRAGISPQAFDLILEDNHKFYTFIENTLNEVVSQKISKQSIELYSELFDRISGYARAHIFPYEGVQKSIAETLRDSVGAALREASESSKTSPITAWKSGFCVKEGDVYILKAARDHEKMVELQKMYSNYREEMRKNFNFDFDDMLIDVIDHIIADSGLHAEIAEKFQYMLVDEYQDTNDAQFNLIRAIMSHPVHEGFPNIMAVGDDDQAIFKFQGADISNILDFRRFFPTSSIIVLTKNYRSVEDVVSISRKVVLTAEDRLENRIEDLSKDLQSMRGQGDKVQYVLLPSQSHEYTWVAEDIHKKITSGIEPSEIAVLGRGHKQLEACVSHLHSVGIPLRYERQLDVMKQSHVSQLIQMIYYVNSLNSESGASDELLPEIIAFPFWGIERIELWKLSQDVYSTKSSWLETMIQSPHEPIQRLATFLINLSVIARYEPGELIIDYLIGSERSLLLGSEDLDEESIEVQPLYNGITSPFRDYYFGEKIFTQHRAEYISFLSSLKVFIQAVREHYRGEKISLADIVAFVNLHQSHQKLVADTSPFVSAAQAVSVMTAHKSKGLEWKVVYVVGCVDNIWASSSRKGLLSFPPNLQITPPGDSEDDFVRLFYVAISRARDQLILTAHERTDTGKEVQPLRFLVSTISPVYPEIIPDVADVLTSSLSVYHTAPLSTDESALLNEVIKNYKMSVTHLNGFLNIARKGPRDFFEQSLLRFPQSKSASAGFGTAMHATIEHIYTHLKYEGVLPSKLHIQDYFSKQLHKQRLTRKETKDYEVKGYTALDGYVKHVKDSINPLDILERSFLHDNICIGDARITGKIDRINIDGTNIIVTDFKTGKPVISWKPSNDNEKIKLHGYRRQLAFYKLLVENAEEFDGKKVIKGQLEFLEPTKEKSFTTLETSIEDEEVARISLLIQAVHGHIIKLNFPDVEKYEKNFKGIISFEDDLLNGII